MPTGKEYPAYDLAPTGVLSFEIGDWYPKPVLTDGGKKKLEGRLNDLLIKMIEDAFESRQRREERARREADIRERERLSAIEEERRLAEEKKIGQWDEWMTAWRRVRRDSCVCPGHSQEASAH